MRKKFFIHSGYFLLLMLFIVVFLFCFAELITIRNYNRRIENVYKTSINYSSNYWADRFYISNTELKSLIDKNDSTDYNLLCNADVGDDIDGLAENLQRDLSNMSIINDNRVMFFAYIPKHDLMLSSFTRITFLEKQALEELRAVVEKAVIKNGANWDAVELGGQVYFLHLYKKNDGISGCYISCEDVLKDIMPDTDGVEAAILNMDGTPFYGTFSENSKISVSYARAIRMINKKICISIPGNRFVNADSYAFLTIAFAIVAALLVIILVSLYQNRTVTQPLMRLGDAMQAFSSGDVGIRLPERTVSSDIEALYHVFNDMADQIVHLKFDVYAKELERERIYRHFLRIQIQPHFYTNILNLIHALAGAEDYQTIQLLVKNLSGYFRYLLTIKEDAVILKEELACIDAFTSIQSIRYQDHFSIRIDCGVDPEKIQIPPLLLQTFVENSIKHNIMMVQGLEILVQIMDNGSGIAYMIRDNGVGFPEEFLERFRVGADTIKHGEQIGIQNVIERLHVLYDDQASIQINNDEIGATVLIHTPYMLAAGEENDEGFDCG